MCQPLLVRGKAAQNPAVQCKIPRMRHGVGKRKRSSTVCKRRKTSSTEVFSSETGVAILALPGASSLARWPQWATSAKQDKPCLCCGRGVCRRSWWLLAEATIRQKLPKASAGMVSLNWNCIAAMHTSRNRPHKQRIVLCAMLPQPKTGQKEKGSYKSGQQAWDATLPGSAKTGNGDRALPRSMQASAHVPGKNRSPAPNSGYCRKIFTDV